jgi:hypothetical protein
MTRALAVLGAAVEGRVGSSCWTNWRDWRTDRAYRYAQALAAAFWWEHSMSNLSIARDGRLPLVTLANPIFVQSRPEVLPAGGTIVFEVLEVDATGMQNLRNIPSQYALDGQAFTGTLVSLEPCKSVQWEGMPGLEDRPTLRGKLEVLKESGERY